MNISAGGACTALSKLVKKGDELLIGFDLQGIKTVAALAKVIWVEEAIDNLKNICGLEFLWLSSESELDDFLAHEKGETGIAAA
jgi:hypothetical protein